jgi:hypothetical protein
MQQTYIQPANAFLSTRVKEPNQGDCFKLKEMLGFLKWTDEDDLILEADDLGKCNHR